MSVNQTIGSFFAVMIIALVAIAFSDSQLGPFFYKTQKILQLEPQPPSNFNGTWHTWYDDLNAEWPYVNGVVDGKVITYREGAVISEIEYSNGVPKY